MKQSLKQQFTAWTMACVLAAGASAALAQSLQSQSQSQQSQQSPRAAPRAPSARPQAQPAQSGMSADELLHDADRIVQQLDAGQYGDVWNALAPFVRQSQVQTEFVGRTRQARQAMGPVVRRGWVNVNRMVIHDVSGVPDGLYGNVDYLTAVAGGNVVPEHLSFHLEGDGHWYLTGYVPRQTASSPAPASDPAADTLQ